MRLFDSLFSVELFFLRNLYIDMVLLFFIIVVIVVGLFEL